MDIKKNERVELAKLGESFVAEQLKRSGFRELYRNFRRPGSELDLVFIRGSDLVIVEVKTRSFEVSDIQHMIPNKKIKSLWMGIAKLLIENPEYCDMTIHLGLAVVSCRKSNPQLIGWWRLPPPKGE